MIVAKSQIVKSLGLMSAVAAKVVNTPVLETVLIIANDKELTLISSDSEMQLKMKVACISSEGWRSCSLNGKKLHDVFKSIPDEGEVNISTISDDMKSVVKSGKSKFTLRGFEHKDFPVMAFTDKDFKSVAVKESELKRLIKLCLTCVASNDVRAFMNGLYMNVENGKLHMVGTDGHRMCFSHIEIEDKEVNCSAIIYKKTMTELLKVLSDSDNLVTISVSSNMARFEVGNVEFVTRLLEGKFPDYRRVIPDTSEFGIEIVADVDTLKKSFSRVGIVSDVAKHVRFDTTTDDGLLISSEMLSNQATIDDVLDQVECDIKRTGKGTTGLYNNEYLAEIVGSISSEKVQIMMKDENTAMVLRFHNDSNPIHTEYAAVVMPVRG
ncbi:MAG: DNA polymerase III subunit beta [Methylophilus sp.]|uniref:DNA polymerase III subunit beta n=1 Tax=Methylophilus sp. TaxID=29541 RepID=UPI003F9EF9BA